MSAPRLSLRRISSSRVQGIEKPPRPEGVPTAESTSLPGSSAATLSSLRPRSRRIRPSNTARHSSSRRRWSSSSVPGLVSVYSTWSSEVSEVKARAFTSTTSPSIWRPRQRAYTASPSGVAIDSSFSRNITSRSLFSVMK